MPTNEPPSRPLIKGKRRNANAPTRWAPGPLSLPLPTIVPRGDPEESITPSLAPFYSLELLILRVTIMTLTKSRRVGSPCPKPSERAV